MFEYEEKNGIMQPASEGKQFSSPITSIHHGSSFICTDTETSSIPAL